MFDAVTRTKRPRRSYKSMVAASTTSVRASSATDVSTGLTHPEERIRSNITVAMDSMMGVSPPKSMHQIPTIPVAGQHTDTTNCESDGDSMSTLSSPRHHSNGGSQELSGTLTPVPAATPELPIFRNISNDTISTNNDETEHLSGASDAKPGDKAKRNREAQRAFRKRREMYIQNLEAQAERYEGLRKQIAGWEKTIKDLHVQISDLTEEKEGWMKDREAILRTQQEYKRQVEALQAECAAMQHENRRLSHILLDLSGHITERLRDKEHGYGGLQQQRQQRERSTGFDGMPTTDATLYSEIPPPPQIQYRSHASVPPYRPGNG
ncbi:hypothetical protein HK102_013135 [Quaeritorhiza haematococci]|nr:hypothetical protein HK102_013135 [Quaeritorhiza haematococci]